MYIFSSLITLVNISNCRKKTFSKLKNKAWALFKEKLCNAADLQQPTKLRPRFIVYLENIEVLKYVKNKTSKNRLYLDTVTSSKLSSYVKKKNHIWCHE